MFVIVGAPYEPLREGEFAAGDTVKVELDPDVWKLMQNGHGGWNDLMGMVRLSLCVGIWLFIELKNNTVYYRS